MKQKENISAMLMQLPDISNIILQFGGEPSYNGILILNFSGRYFPTYKQSKINEDKFGDILDSEEWC